MSALRILLTMALLAGLPGCPGRDSPVPPPAPPTPTAEDHQVRLDEPAASLPAVEAPRRVPSMPDGHPIIPGGLPVALEGYPLVSSEPGEGIVGLRSGFKTGARPRRE